VTPRGKKRLEYTIYALIFSIPVALPFVRCWMLKSADGRAVSARVEDRGGRSVLVLVDEVCTGGNNDIPDCDKRTIEVSLPDGKKLDTDISNDFVRHELPQCPRRISLGVDWVEIDDVADGIGIARRATAGGLEGAWSAKVPGECQLATIVGGVLVIATSNADHRAVGIDLETGKRLWRVRP
jgi:hypothetical protein